MSHITNGVRDRRVKLALVDRSAASFLSTYESSLQRSPACVVAAAHEREAMGIRARGIKIMAYPDGALTGRCVSALLAHVLCAKLGLCLLQVSRRVAGWSEPER